ncbi:hypothetical protein [Psychrobacter urativorans]|uniref:hypothetical protein n=1 Tax=Psychrobacter urativorans TaxID=45610 RepID=UPI001918DCEA|nr:hypothetical protein [Psychrobacter urativorans]
MVILLSIVIGPVQFCSVISLSIALLMGVRMIVSAPENRIKLIMISVVTIVMFYYVRVTLNGMKIECNDGFLVPTVLLTSVFTILWQFWSMAVLGHLSQIYK